MSIENNNKHMEKENINHVDEVKKVLPKNMKKTKVEYIENIINKILKENKKLFEEINELKKSNLKKSNTKNNTGKINEEKTIFKVLPAEIIGRILTYLTIDDLFIFSTACKFLNKCVFIKLKCKCSSVLQKKQDFFIFRQCYKCKIFLCKNCQLPCNDYNGCENVFCNDCSNNKVCDTCYKCEKYLKYNEFDSDEVDIFMSDSNEDE